MLSPAVGCEPPQARRLCCARVRMYYGRSSIKFCVSGVCDRARLFFFTDNCSGESIDFIRKKPVGNYSPSLLRVYRRSVRHDLHFLDRRRIIHLLGFPHTTRTPNMAAPSFPRQKTRSGWQSICVHRNQTQSNRCYVSFLFSVKKHSVKSSQVSSLCAEQAASVLSSNGSLPFF